MKNSNLPYENDLNIEFGTSKVALDSNDQNITYNLHNHLRFKTLENQETLGKA